MKIDTAFPIPAKRCVYNFGEMKIGDSVFFNGCNHNSKQVAAAKIFFKRRGQKIASRLTDGGIRVWRVE